MINDGEVPFKKYCEYYERASYLENGNEEPKTLDFIDSQNAFWNFLMLTRVCSRMRTGMTTEFFKIDI